MENLFKLFGEIEYPDQKENHKNDQFAVARRIDGRSEKCRKSSKKGILDLTGCVTSATWQISSV